MTLMISHDPRMRGGPVKKVSIVGAGNVGATLAFLIGSNDLADVVLIDVVEGISEGKALDISQASAVLEFDARVNGANDFAALTGSDIVVITAGLPRQPGMSRLDLLEKNAQIVRTVTEQIVQRAPQAKILIVTNPLDVMACLAFKVSGFEKNRVFGMGGNLDSARFEYFIASELGVSVLEVSGLVLGSHGDSMVPLPRLSTVSGQALTEMLSGETIDRLVERTKRAGAEIVAYLKSGSAYYAPASAAYEIVSQVLTDNKAILPVSTYLDGEYGLSDVFISVPVILGSNGVESIIELDLTEDELDLLKASADNVREGIALLRP